MRLYEAMILVTTAEASRDWEGLIQHITDILTRNGAEVVDVRKWGERKLAYEIEHQRKAAYVLIHFQAPTNVIAEARRELQLSERILRHLIMVDEDGVEVKLLSELEEAQERDGSRRGRPRRAAGSAPGEKEGQKEEAKESEEADQTGEAAAAAVGEEGEKPSEEQGQEA